jgi:hypothetical protein
MSLAIPLLIKQSLSLCNSHRLRVWRYQRGAKRKKGKQYKERSTKHTHTTKDRVTLTPLKTQVNSGAQIHN